jgi:hypothetical protein
LGWNHSVGGSVLRAIHGALLDYLRDQEIRDGPQPRALACRGRDAGFIFTYIAQDFFFTS